MRSFLIGVSTVLGLLLLLNLLPIVLFPDTPAPTNSRWELRTEKLDGKLEPAQNAMQAFSQASQQLRLEGIEPRGFLQPDSWIQSEAARLIGRNEAALQALERGAKLERSQSGLRDLNVQTREAFEQASLNSGLIGAAQATNVLLVRAKLKLLSSDDAGAWTDMQTALRVGQRILEARGDSLQFEIGASVWNAALTEMRLALAKTDFKPEVWRAPLAFLQRFAMSDSAVLETLRTDFYYGELLLQNPRPAFPANLVPRGYSLQPNRSRQALVKALDEQFALNQNCAQLKAFTAPKRENPMWFELNSLGRSAVGAALGAAETAITACQMRQNLNATVILIALRAEQARAGQRAPSLEALRDWLPTRPNDPFGNKDFLYEPQNQLLRGANGIGYRLEF
jgi:hypothetical protein